MARSAAFDGPLATSTASTSPPSSISVRSRDLVDLRRRRRCRSTARAMVELGAQLLAQKTPDGGGPPRCATRSGQRSGSAGPASRAATNSPARGTSAPAHRHPPPPRSTRAFAARPQAARVPVPYAPPRPPSSTSVRTGLRPGRLRGCHRRPCTGRRRRTEPLARHLHRRRPRRVRRARRAARRSGAATGEDDSTRTALSAPPGASFTISQFAPSRSRSPTTISGHEHDRRPAAAAARPGQGPVLRARRRVPRRPAGGLRPRPGRPGPGGQGGAGDRVFVLGHHYQRDEVIQFADVTGDSFKLARDAAARPEAEYIVFCGVHFMAESADILTAPEQKVILPDLAAGCSMADMARIAQVEDAWDALTEAGIADVGRAGHLHELLRRHQGVLRPQRRRGLHVLQRRGRARLGVRPARRDTRCSSSPTSTSAATPRCSRWAHPRGLRGLGPAPAQRRPDRRAAAGRQDDPVARPLLGARPLLPRLRRRPARDDPRHQHPGAPGVHARGGAQGRPRRVDGVHHQDDRGGPGRLAWAIGTELNLVQRLATQHPDKQSSSSTRPSASARR